MKIEIAKLIVKALVARGHDADVYEDYSGRGMYTNTTDAVETNASLGETLKCVMIYMVSSEQRPWYICEHGIDCTNEGVVCGACEIGD